MLVKVSREVGFDYQRGSFWKESSLVSIKKARLLSSPPWTPFIRDKVGNGGFSPLAAHPPLHRRHERATPPSKLPSLPPRGGQRAAAPLRILCHCLVEVRFPLTRGLPGGGWSLLGGGNICRKLRTATRANAPPFFCVACPPAYLPACLPACLPPFSFTEGRSLGAGRKEYQLRGLVRRAEAKKDKQPHRGTREVRQCVSEREAILE